MGTLPHRMHLLLPLLHHRRDCANCCCGMGAAASTASAVAAAAWTTRVRQLQWRSAVAEDVRIDIYSGPSRVANRECNGELTSTPTPELLIGSALVWLAANASAVTPETSGMPARVRSRMHHLELLVAASRHGKDAELVQKPLGRLRVEVLGH